MSALSLLPTVQSALDRGAKGRIVKSEHGRRIRCLMAGLTFSNPIVVNWAHAVEQFSDVYGLAFGDSHPEGWEKVSNRAAVGLMDGIPTLYLRVRHFKPTRLFWRLNAFRDAGEFRDALSRWEIPGLDVVHGHWYASSPALLRFARTLGIPYIHTEHYTGLLEGGQGVSPAGERMLSDIGRSAAGVISVGAEVASALEKRGIRSAIIPNPVRVPGFRVSRKATSEEAVRLVTVARLVPHKRIGLLVDAFALIAQSNQLPKMTLTIIGGGPERVSLEQKISSRGLRGLVELTGWMEPAEVLAKLEESQIYVHPSSIETFSVSLVEAMMLGLPVVVAKAGGVTEQVQPWMGQLVARSSPEKFAEAIALVISEIESFDRAAIARWARTHFGIDAVARELEIFYKTVLTS